MIHNSSFRMHKFWFKITLVNLIIFTFFAIDRFLKYLALTFSVDSGFFVFEKNYSLAFGIPLPLIWVYILISSILLILSFLLIRAYKKKNLFLIISFTLIFLGALSNLIDRFNYGYVIDYINLFPFPILNLGDVMVVGGIGGLFFWWGGGRIKNADR